MIDDLTELFPIDVLQMIEKNWDFMARDDCTPVQVALQLMDNSTLGKADREPEFLNMHKQIKRTLRSIVNRMFPDTVSRVHCWLMGYPLQNTTRGSTVL